MSNHSHCKCRSPAPKPQADAPVFREPPMQRWPHPIPVSAPCISDPALDAIGRALSCQTQLLEEIRNLAAQNHALLVQLTANAEGKTP